MISLPTATQRLDIDLRAGVDSAWEQGAKRLEATLCEMFAVGVAAAQRLDIDLRASVDSAWKQEKLEVRKILENAVTPTRRVHALLGVFEA